MRLAMYSTKNLDPNRVRDAMSYDDWDVQTEADEFAYERAQDEAIKRRAKAQWQEDRDTGMELDPLMFEPREEEEEV